MNTMNAMIAYWSFHWVRFTSGNNDKKNKTKTKTKKVNRTEHHVYFSALPTCDFPQLVFL